MRRIVLPILVVLSVAPSARAHADEPNLRYQRPSVEPTAWNGLTINPVEIALGRFNLTYERVLNAHLSLAIDGAYMHSSTNLVSNDTLSMNAFAGGFSPHFYFLRPAPGGLYLAPFVRLAYVTGTAQRAVGDGFGYASGATIGWSWVVGAFNLKLGAGAAYWDVLARATDSSGRAGTAGFQGVLPSVDLSIGAVF